MVACAGIALDFGTAYGIVMVGSFIGMSIQYWAARYIFKDKVGGLSHCVLFGVSSRVHYTAYRALGAGLKLVMESLGGAMWELFSLLLGCKSRRQPVG